MAAKLFRTCPECGVRFELKHHRAQFCTPEHAKVFNNRELARGQKLIGLAKAWRGARSIKDGAVREAGKSAFIEMCRYVDACNAEDRERTGGGVHPTNLYRRRVAAGSLG